MVRSGFDIISGKLPEGLYNKSVCLVCHAPSINSSYRHIIDFFAESPSVRLVSVMGPQHGIFGQTQDNMIEWEGSFHADYAIPVYSLYGKNRKPTPEMLRGADTMVIDLQDIGSRPYTYIWTMKHCMEACREQNIPVWVLDRPNPVAGLGIEGPVLNRNYFTFVGGAEIPLLHSLTIGEIASWLNCFEETGCDLHVVKMENWRREMNFPDTGLPWVLPSPNMPSFNTSVVYPGMVLIEALNLSEGRGTTTPFELIGAPWIKTRDLIRNLIGQSLKGCVFREHDFIPTFNKYAGSYCHGLFIHITDSSIYRPVITALKIFEAIQETSPGFLSFNPPPYEYEENLVPFDILAGDSLTRVTLEEGNNLREEENRWQEGIAEFRRKSKEIMIY